MKTVRLFRRQLASWSKVPWLPFLFLLNFVVIVTLLFHIITDGMG